MYESRCLINLSGCTMNHKILVSCYSRCGRAVHLLYEVSAKDTRKYSYIGTLFMFLPCAGISEVDLSPFNNKLNIVQIYETSL